MGYGLGFGVEVLRSRVWDYLAAYRDRNGGGGVAIGPASLRQPLPDPDVFVLDSGAWFSALVLWCILSPRPRGGTCTFGAPSTVCTCIFVLMSCAMSLPGGVWRRRRRGGACTCAARSTRTFAVWAEGSGTSFFRVEGLG